MDNQLAQTQWIAGSQFSVADIALFAYSHLANEGGFDLKARPHVVRWIAECRTALGLG